ncbi:MAG: tRNA modification GTPase MnmE [Candidatus Omnitrophica bacterium ADurb.Bin292]|nr:MAG: tRNA modification GTPase MnmE [Candidatus Omnitrophica bacterium ADurb.Bin292]HQB12804.1 tRNA uridine-5-carboxymethylaminomethyl(34) synthesis GTPase MnmE [Candidatus Omnitrophota bacterium]
MAKLELDDTIAAIATPLGEGGISVIRLSGPGAFDCLRPFFLSTSRKSPDTFPPNTIHWGRVVDSEGKLIDQVLLSVFRSPQSYTGQDVLEVSCHGGLAVTKRILGLFLSNGARHAEPGEFTRRAFLNGKIDLSQAEAVLDLIHAKSNRSLDIAIRQLTGELSKRFQGLKDLILRLLAHMEAYIDFPDENLEVDVSSGMERQFSELLKTIRALLEGFDRNQLVREGALVTIVGKPNAGKSSLFNALLERDRALVSELPHTTRDHLEESLEIKGFYVRLRDTAGLVSTPEQALDKLGMDRTLRALKESHLVLFLTDGSRPLDDSDQHVFEQIPNGKKVIILINKSDLPEKLERTELARLTGRTDPVGISTKTREGLKEIEQQIAAFLEQDMAGEGEQVTRLRHKRALEKALELIERAELSFREKERFELITIDLRAALEIMKELTGEVHSEELLDMIFSEFCIGK